MRKLFISSMVSIIILIGALLFGQTLRYEEETLRTRQVNTFSQGWLLNVKGSPNNRIINLPYHVDENKADNVISIQKRLPLQNFPNPSLRISSVHQKVKVFLDEELIYQFNSLEEINYGRVAGNACLIVELPHDCFGKQVRIEFESPLEQTAGLIYKVVFGTRDYNILLLYNQSSVKMMIAFSLFLAGLLILIFIFCINRKYKIGYQGIYLVGMILCSVLKIVGRSQGYLFIYNNYAFNYYVQLNVLFIFPVLLYRYIYYRYKMTYKRIILWLADIHLGCWALILLMQLLGVMSLDIMQKAYIIFFYITLLICTGIAIKHISSKEVQPNSKKIGALIGILIMIIIDMLVNLFAHDIASIQMGVTSMVLFAIFAEGVILFKTFSTLVQWIETTYHNMFLKLQLDNQLQHYLLLEKKYTHYRQIQHDTMNHWKVVNRLAHEENIKEIQHYTALMLEDIEEQKQKVFETGNYILDAILTDKVHQANELGIKVTHEIFIKKDIAIDVLDWCSIYGNALDNAIEACKKIDGFKWINIKIYYKNGQIICKIQNAINKDTLFHTNYETTKDNKERHGLGLKNMRDSIEKYGGELHISHTREMFEISFVLFEI